MALSQLGHDADGVETRVLRERVGNDLQRLRVRTRLPLTTLFRTHNIPIGAGERLDPPVSYTHLTLPTNSRV